jgi:hypothetical protein
VLAGRRSVAPVRMAYAAEDPSPGALKKLVEKAKELKRYVPHTHPPAYFGILKYTSACEKISCSGAFVMIFGSKVLS